MRTNSSEKYNPVAELKLDMDTCILTYAAFRRGTLVNKKKLCKAAGVTSTQLESLLRQRKQVKDPPRLNMVVAGSVFAALEKARAGDEPEIDVAPFVIVRLNREQREYMGKNRPIATLVLNLDGLLSTYAERYTTANGKHPLMFKNSYNMTEICKRAGIDPAWIRWMLYRRTNNPQLNMVAFGSLFAALGVPVRAPFHIVSKLPPSNQPSDLVAKSTHVRTGLRRGEIDGTIGMPDLRRSDEW